ncbi:MAG: SCO1664 family protein [Anaerolineae bacterium]|nr:SCO1664 family protein [Anaerolineae bacterium]
MSTRRGRGGRCTAEVDPERILVLLSQGHLEPLGRMPAGSNVIFLTRVVARKGGAEVLAVYKPGCGERPLWDFPHGTLCFREVAAYLVSRELGWPSVPPTVLRDGPYGIGALQLYIDALPQANYFTLRTERLPDLMPIALFDLVTNNVDRKGGHLLLDREGRIWAIDNALTFHPLPKLRTVIWDFAGEAIPSSYLADLSRFQEQLNKPTPIIETLSMLLSAEELAALRRRLAALLERGVFPRPDPTRRQLPWPLV